MNRYFIVLIVAFSSISYADKWNGTSEINDLAIYPGYAIINLPGGVAGCGHPDLVSFSWNDFDPLVQNRIQSMLLHAYTTKQKIDVLVHDTACGPEGFKKFLGHIRYRD